MKGPRSFVPAGMLVLAAALYMIFGATASNASDIYISQNAAGANTGSDCADAHSASWFNTGSNWGSSAGKIGAGTTAHLCGTFTSPMNGQGSGSSGSPITILFESGARISVPFCPSGGCMNFNGLSWITIDGGTPCGPSTTCNSNDSGTGLVEATANGTNLANRVVSQGLYCQSCNHVEIKNLIIRNMYVYVGPNDESVDHSSVQCVNVNGSNISVHDSTMHDAGWCLINGFQSGDSNVSFYNIDVHNIDHGYVLSGPKTSITAGPFYFYNNHLYAFANWDDTSNNNHHDGIHCFSGSSSGQTINGWYVYNNTFGGPEGVGMNAFVYIEGSSGPPCMNTGSSAYFFNNLGIADHYSNVGIFAFLCGVWTIENNTLIGSNTPNAGTGWQLESESTGETANATFLNNVSTISNVLGSIQNVGDFKSGPDYNIYSLDGQNSATPFNFNGNYYTFSSYKTAVNAEGHSLQAASSGLNNTTGIPTSGSPVISAGTNLSSTCSGQSIPGLGALCRDGNGNPRPSSGAWDAGAYLFATGNTGNAQPNPPTALAATVH